MGNPWKNGKRPNSTMEWVIGANLDDIFRKREKCTKGIVTVSVSTDDETESDTVSITYPRTTIKKPTKTVAGINSKQTTKRVQFTDLQPTLKSAMKKTAAEVGAASSDSATDSGTESSADSSTPDSGSRPVEKLSEASDSPPKFHETVKGKSQHAEPLGDSDKNESSDDSAPHPTCTCIDCIRARQKLRRFGKRAKKSGSSPPDSETTGSEGSEYTKSSVSESDPEGNQKKHRKQRDSRNDNSQVESTTESESPDSSKETFSKQQHKSRKHGKPGKAIKLDSTSTEPSSTDPESGKDHKKHSRTKDKHNHEEKIFDNQKAKKEDGKETSEPEVSANENAVLTESEATQTEEEASAQKLSSIEKEKSSKRSKPRKGEQIETPERKNSTKSGKDTKATSKKGTENKAKDIDPKVGDNSFDVEGNGKAPAAGKIRRDKEMASEEKIIPLTRNTTRRKKDTKDNYPYLYGGPALRQPRLIMPVHARVLQVEHAIETPDDPVPNAFIDVQNGIVRQYHGPAYGNATGILYPRRRYNGTDLPLGTPHPLNNPYYYGFHPGGNQAVDQTSSQNVPPEGIIPTTVAPVGAILQPMMPPVLGHPLNFEWARPEPVASDALTVEKPPKKEASSDRKANQSGQCIGTEAEDSNKQSSDSSTVTRKAENPKDLHSDLSGRPLDNNPYKKGGHACGIDSRKRDKESRRDHASYHSRHDETSSHKHHDKGIPEDYGAGKDRNSSWNKRGSQNYGPQADPWGFLNQPSSSKGSKDSHAQKLGGEDSGSRGKNDSWPANSQNADSRNWSGSGQHNGWGQNQQTSGWGNGSGRSGDSMNRSGREGWGSNTDGRDSGHQKRSRRNDGNGPPHTGNWGGNSSGWDNQNSRFGRNDGSNTRSGGCGGNNNRCSGGESHNNRDARGHGNSKGWGCDWRNDDRSNHKSGWNNDNCQDQRGGGENPGQNDGWGNSRDSGNHRDEWNDGSYHGSRQGSGANGGSHNSGSRSNNNTTNDIWGWDDNKNSSSRRDNNNSGNCASGWDTRGGNLDGHNTDGRLGSGDGNGNSGWDSNSHGSHHSNRSKKSRENSGGSNVAGDGGGESAWDNGNSGETQGTGWQGGSGDNGNSGWGNTSGHGDNFGWNDNGSDHINTSWNNNNGHGSGGGDRSLSGRPGNSGEAGQHQRDYKSKSRHHRNKSASGWKPSEAMPGGWGTPPSSGGKEPDREGAEVVDQGTSSLGAWADPTLAQSTGGEADFW